MIAATGTDLATSLLVFAGGGGGVALITGLFGHRRTRAEANDINATATLKMSDSWERLVAQLQERLDDQDTKIAAQDVKIAAQARHSVEQDAQIRHLVTEVATP